MSSTTLVAVYGAVTGTVGALTGLGSWRNAVWGRRARSRDLRTNLEPIRDALNEAKATPQRAATVTNNIQFRAHVEAVGEAVERCPTGGCASTFSR